MNDDYISLHSFPKKGKTANILKANRYTLQRRNKATEWAMEEYCDMLPESWNIGFGQYRHIRHSTPLKALRDNSYVINCSLCNGC
jgi:hypothetical protein